jgi:hypothetical protein
MMERKKDSLNESPKRLNYQLTITIIRSNPDNDERAIPNGVFNRR